MAAETGEVELNYKDHCLIIVGHGGEADELLARRRLEAGGRLAHILYSKEDQVEVVGEEDEVIFTWHPPRGARSDFGRKLGPHMETLHTTTGPDCIELEDQQVLQIFTRKSRMNLVRLVDKERVLMEMSGQVILKPDAELSKTLDVEVEDPDLKSFGTYSRLRVLQFLAGTVLWKTLQISIHIAFETKAGGELPWWRGVLMLANGFLGYAGIWKMVASSLSGEKDLGLTHKIFCLLCLVLIVMAVAVAAHVAQFPATVVSASALFLCGPPIQYYQTRHKYPDRRFASCLLWALANFASTLGGAAMLCTIVVAYRLLLENNQSVAASFVLPLGSALVEHLMVAYTRFAYTKLVVEKRPAVPGDVTFVAIPYMLAASHGLPEGARLMGVFAGAITSGGYSWLGTLGLTLILNCMARTGWLRLACFYALKRTLGLPCALACAPTAFSKLHDETKVYVGYFRFPGILAIVFARAIVYQDLSFSHPRSAFFNASAALALLSMLIMEVLEDYIVIQQVVPTSPILTEFLDNDLHKKSRHTSLVSTEVRRVKLGPAERWRLDELDADGFRVTNVSSSQRQASLKLSSVLPSPVEPGSTVPAPEMKHPTRPFRDPSLLESQTEPQVFGRQASVLTLQQSWCLQQEAQQLPSLGRRRVSLQWRVRRWFGQERVVESSLLLHGLRQMPWDCQLGVVTIATELTVGMLDLVVGPGYIRGVVPELCKSLSLHGLFISTSPLAC